MDRFATLQQALRSAPPHALARVVTEELRGRYGAGRVELRMVDYGMTSLQSVDGQTADAEPVSVHDSPQGRAFGSQQPFTVQQPDGGAVVHLPVTLRGDRLGTLSVGLPSAADPDGMLPALQQVCEALGHEILVAERDTDVFLLARRVSRLTLAAEMQWQLLPGRTCVRDEFEVGAHLEPAYAIHGDSFDWEASERYLTLAVTNGMGEGIEAALLTNLATNALRNARRAGLDLAGQATLADQAVYAQYRGAAYVSVLLLRFELSTGRVAVVDAGSPKMWRIRGRDVAAVPFDHQLPLGMFEDTVYVEESFTVQSGDRLLIGSDGVYDTPLGPAGEASPGREREKYGERALARSLPGHRLLPAGLVPAAVLRELANYRGEAPLQDDALVMCVDWHGSPTSPG
ncbi:PP2C family protein-serine/threonine phosphatase [Streptomyces sp. WMMB303]|uniref:PP2C family protein-serine/threonine phosphatase n=1 Tax=Streptomyces sp. WMMB303 TaxID=3034154 RepID=UPI0023EDDA53|nr:PP2C family protein-serine/threonine phosphatase [Streptomyces sp. WMMB303]MDF4251064.1 PP2C family protein-serine/threonine phosphatase [Streptomyces sp. WMMB303]